MAAVVFTNVWRGIPFFAIMLLAGLQAVPDELYEAAHVDGAGVLARFWHITLPLLRPIIVVATATRIIWTFNYADLIFVMTGGGPANATQITSTYTLAAGLFEPRLRLRRRALGRAAARHAGIHGPLPARHQRRRGNRMTRRRASTDLAERLLGGPVVWIGLVLLTAFALGPFIWMLLTSLKDRQELYATPLQYLPVHPTFENYVDAWTSPVTPFSRFFLNSLWVCSVTMVATTVVSVLAGYAIARFRFAGRDALLLIFLATQMFPSVLLIAPLLTQWRALGLIDTYQALIYSNFSFTVPFTVWMMVGYFSLDPARPRGKRDDRRLQPFRRALPHRAAARRPRHRRDRHFRLRGVLERAAVRDLLHHRRPTCARCRPACSTWSGSTRCNGGRSRPASS